MILTGAGTIGVSKAKMEGISISRLVDILDIRDRETLRSVIRMLRPWTQASLDGLEKRIMMMQLRLLSEEAGIRLPIWQRLKPEPRVKV